MKHYLYPALATIVCISSVQASPQIDRIKEMKELFQQSVAILKSCKDAASTKTATASLIKLRDKSDEIRKKVTQEGASSQEELDKIKSLNDSFLPIAEQVEKEVERIKKDSLFTPELATALRIPDKNASPQLHAIREVQGIYHQSITIMKSCKDAESTKTAIGQLIKLRDKSDEIFKKLDQMGAPPKEDLFMCQSINDSFFLLKEQGDKEVERIKNANLFTPELAAALGYPAEEAAPETDRKEEPPAANDASDPAPSAK